MKDQNRELLEDYTGERSVINVISDRDVISINFESSGIGTIQLEEHFNKHEVAIVSVVQDDKISSKLVGPALKILSAISGLSIYKQRLAIGA